jgi:phosphoglycolate phosphatase
MHEFAEGTSRFVVFDFDGTVADTWRDIATALNQTFVEFGFAPVEGPEVRYWIGDGARKLLLRAVPESHRSEDAIDELYERFAEHYDRVCLETTELYPGVLDCLAALRGVPLAIASNKPERFLMRIVEGLGLKEHFSLLAGGDTLAVRKPDPTVLLDLRDRLSSPAETMWMVGDSAVDVETGRAAGARTIGCGWGMRGRDELRRANVHFLVEHPREIPRIILGAS